MRSLRSPPFARRRTVRSRPVPYLIFPVDEPPIDRSRAPTPPAADRHCPDVRGSGVVFMPGHHWKIFAPVYGSAAGRVGALFRRLSVGTYLSQSDHKTQDDEDDAAIHAIWPLGAAAWIDCIEFFRAALPPA